jgi:hypothetical protein
MKLRSLIKISIKLFHWQLIDSKNLKINEMKSKLRINQPQSQLKNEIKNEEPTCYRTRSKSVTLSDRAWWCRGGESEVKRILFL